MHDLDGIFLYNVSLHAKLGRQTLRLWVNTSPHTEGICDECRLPTTSCSSLGFILTSENQRGHLGEPQNAISKPQRNHQRGTGGALEESQRRVIS